MDKLKFNNIIGWQKNSFIDFPGTVSTVLFFAHCNLKCPYCHNPDIVQNLLPPINSDEFWAFLEKRKNNIKGVVLTGGEPTLHSNLKKIICEIKKQGIKVKLDSNGLLPERIDEISRYIDYLAVDVKTSPELYNKILGCNYDDCYERIGSTLNIATASKIEYEIRITVAPNLIDENICRKIGKLIKGSKKVFLQKFKSGKLLDISYSKVEPFTDNEMENFKQILLTYDTHCEIR